MKLSDLGDDFEVVSQPSSKRQTFADFGKTTISDKGFDKAQSNLAFSQSTLDRIRTGQAQQNVEVAKGFGKGALSTFSQAGAQAAGPVGAEMLRGAPAFAQNIQQKEQAVTPQNQLQAEGFGMERLAEVTSPLPVASTVSPVVSTATKKLGQGIKGLGKKIYETVMPVGKREAQLVQAYKAKVPFKERLASALTDSEMAIQAPRTVADTAIEQGLKGREATVGIKAKRAADTIWKDVIGPKLESSSDAVDMQKFFDEIGEQIVKDTPEMSRQKSLLEGLQALKEDYADVGTVPLKQLQDFKSGWAQFVPEKFYQGKPIAGAFKEVTAVAADKARKKLYETLGDEAKDAYIDYGNLQSLVELGQTAMTGGRFKGGFGSFWDAVKDMALTPVATVGGNTIYRTGKGIELVGEAGAKTLSDLAVFRTLKEILGDTDQESQDISPVAPEGNLPFSQFTTQ